MDVRVRVGLNIATARRDRSLTQEELAAKADVNQSYLSEVEIGKRNPTIAMLDRIATALGLDIADLTKRRSTR
jgi:transcriptional regulator with XRE-family HTH domain